MKHLLQVRSPWLILVLLAMIGALVLGQSWLSGAALAGPASMAAVPPAPPGGTAPGALPKIAPYVLNTDVRALPYVPSNRRLDREVGEPAPTKKFPAGQIVGSPNISLAPMPSPLQNFAGMNFADMCTGGQCGAGFPPDINGDVGTNHYIMAVNDAFAIYNKTGALLASFTENSLWGPAGAPPCTGNSQGDPVVVYDALADRWILTNFAFAFSGGAPVAPFYECVAVSKTSDPVAGGWYLYALQMDPGGTNLPPTGTLNDYPKFGIWTDCLYMAANGFHYPGGAFAGTEFASFSRSDMYAGASLTGALGFIANTTDPFTMIPSNLAAPAGANPPAGTPNYFVSESQTAFTFEVRKFTAGTNCGATGASFGAAVNVSQTSYTVPGQNIVPQPNTTNTLDSLGDRLMQKVQYRKVGSAESLWVTHTTRGGATATTRPQWAQINVTGGTVATTPVQQQIYAPDTTLYRWMPSIAADKDGNVALGYSTSNATAPNFPSIAYSGRLVGDPANTLPQTEVQLIAGGGSQTNNCGGAPCHRWGDYTAMTVDPVDGCTFWYTNEYYDTQASGTAGNWHTRVGSFKFPSCAPLATATTTSTATGTATSTANPTATQTATSTAIPTATTTATSTANPTATRTATTTAIPTATQTATTTANPTATQTATAAATGTATTTATPIACGTSTVITGALDANDPTAPDRLTRSGTPSNCATPNACPGPSFAGTVHYDSYTFANTTGSPQCVTVRVDAPLCDVVSATYLTVFDPATLCANYLGDSGGSTQGGGALNYSITVPAGGQFVVLVEETNPNTFCGTYTLTVGGCGLATPTVTTTALATATETQTALATATETQTVLATVTETATAGATETETAVATVTETGTVLATVTETGTAVATVTETGTAGPTGTATWTVTVTGTPTDTPIASVTTTAGPTNTGVPVNTATRTAGPTNTVAPANTATPTATATPVNCPLPFTDVDQFNPFYQFIQCLYCRGIISGYADNTFRWGNDVTRGQVTKFVANAAGLNDTVSGQTFTDVPPSNPFYVFIERLYRHGDINGYDTAANCPTGIPCFRWELPVTRGQLSKIDSNAAGYNETPPPGTQHFNDTPPANPFYIWIERLSLHGVINGYDCGGPGEPCPGVYFRPFANITRGQTSKVVSQSFFPNACAPARR